LHVTFIINGAGRPAPLRARVDCPLHARHLHAAARIRAME
jgi:hypothetical protein